MVGLLAGIIGAVISFALSIPIGLLVSPVERQMLERLRELSGAVPDTASFDFDRPGAFGMVAIRIVVFFFTLIVGSMVSTLAGLVGAALFAKPRVLAPPDRSTE
jgi:hypothetical protein